MSATLASSNTLVQQTFDWDANSNGQLVTGRRRSESGSSIPSTKVGVPRVTVPTVKQTSCVRRGRCEHVGGVMANVLSKYGIGLDELLGAIEDLRTRRGG